MKYQNDFKNLFYGLIIGSTMSVPGVSGGSTAIILGIYEKLIFAVSNIRNDLKENIRFLSEIALGGALGIYFISGAVLWLTQNFNIEAMYFFIGAILGGIPLLIKQSGLHQRNFYQILYCVLGIILAVCLEFLPCAQAGRSGNMVWDSFMLFISGMIIAAAIVLPGISTSHILLVLGLYESVFQAIHEFDWLYLLFIALGGIIGIFLTSKLTEFFLKKYCCETYMIIIGFIMATVYSVFPGLPQNVTEILWCFPLLLAGFWSIYFLGRKSE